MSHKPSQKATFYVAFPKYSGYSSKSITFGGIFLNNWEDLVKLLPYVLFILNNQEIWGKMPIILVKWLHHRWLFPNNQKILFKTHMLCNHYMGLLLKN